ncbi:DUF6931 family protein [Limnoglobus roseus]|uniref:Uncharacterized protein n=1 Tax=Limnoglobus roseus TaxID=2598579 RepID=A0A5C1ANW4_9BACT|nr:hypothetical protein [Limnoglobus roseus]QEL19442.1 hypothetical protein PX52LOC_06514 [Limnoglobus roseus]
MGGRWPQTAAEVYAKYPIHPAAAALDRGATDGQTFLAALVAAGQYRDAVTFLANALPIRESLWWACECAGDGPATEACRQYVCEPTDANRRAAWAAAEAADFDTPGATAAVAAFLSAGSLSEPGLPAVPPPDGVAATAVANTIILAAAVNGPPTLADERYREYLIVGTAVADGARRWPAPPGQK